MGNSSSYKGYDITWDEQTKLYYIRKGGRYGVSVGTAKDLAEAKRIVDALR